MISTSDDINEILNWLSSRMTKLEKIKMFDDLAVKNANELCIKWDELEVKDRVKKEVRKRTEVKDCKFNLPLYKRFVPRTFIDMSSIDD